MRHMRWRALALAAGLATAAFSASTSATAQSIDPDDPLRSVMWGTVKQVLFPGAETVFDDRVQVISPAVVEDNMNVPVAVRVNGLLDVEEIVLFVDHNPVFKALSYFPTQAAPAFETVIKVQEATPIRAAARTSDGIWHVGGLRVDAAGGGCTLPSIATSQDDWSRLNEVSGRVWKRGGGARLRVQVVHPMDTGLVDGIPPFFIERLTLSTPDGRELARLEVAEPVSEDPVFTLDVLGHDGDIVIAGADNEGNQIAGRLTGGDGLGAVLGGGVR